MPINNLLKEKRNLNKILRNWNINNYQSAKLLHSYGGDVLLITVDNNRKFVLKAKNSLIKTKREHLLLSHLSNKGIPVSVPMLLNNNNSYININGTYYCLYPFITGKIIKNHYVKGYLLRSLILGEAISKLHLALKTVNIHNKFPNMDLYQEICTYVTYNLISHSEYLDINFINSVIKCIKKDFRSLYHKLPVQLIHRDINPSNMIYKKGKVVGYIDFEMVLNGARIFDVCYCASSILAGGFNNVNNRKKWFSILQSLLKGYSKRIRITKAELKSIYYVLLSIQLLFMSYCINRNLKAALYNSRVLSWLVSNREKIKKYLIR